ncbi:TIGR03364 family FAD-dependent oxidoreductase [Actimicrobium sp. CCC2.4]|uniref:TIGR03364 family FAD-dependent oxidoreductase n=1 Tax=Actimicrobium sp. CCC2.4 TaxID=3048606 RepID=UPI002AC9D6D3|nr:TIGR03364 family FAD-dependent oxidoreductase [Actimicrobium sp. CCC2.4]MEB0137151.1 TIGR03364 family FAD-dependent oxidoreductase [Actimicrobium sp. CCC2.4]WPX30916.1 TIGR03364 family FAD-dependent oxidoreductase [Actimicrobium sp. CCC2.4]
MTSGHRTAVIGAGIVGLAHAWAASLRGDSVTVYERDTQASGASVRNFGLGLVLGQPAGELVELAQQSRAMWLDFFADTGCWHKAEGSLVVARSATELRVLEAFQEARGAQYGTRLLVRDEVAAQQVSGFGALFSPSEIAMDARQVIAVLTRWLAERHGVTFEFSVQVNAIDLPRLDTSRGQRSADEVVLCSGHDVQSLYPQHFAALGIRRCALQMQRLANPGVRLGPTMMTGLSTLHYGAFTECAALAGPLAALRDEVAQQQPALLEHGIHLIVQQVGDEGDLIIGDSHAIGETVAPFNDESVDTLILDLAQRLLQRPLQVRERWQGIYASGRRALEVLYPAPQVQAVVITSGIGMSIAFALARRQLAQ